MKSFHVCRKKRSGTPVARSVVIGMILLLVATAFPAGVWAVDVAGDSRTYLRTRETAAGDNLMPLYEYLNLAVTNAGSEAMSFHVGGWLRYDLQDDTRGKSRNSDLQYAYLSYRSANDNRILNLGRVMVFEGVAAERVDGLYARTDLAGGFGLSAFGGVPVEVGGDTGGNNVIYGGRLAHQSANLYTFGVSYLKQEKDSQEYREEQGVDILLRPLKKVEILGRSSYNVRTSGWMEHSYFLLLGPFDKLRLHTRASMINYEDYFTAVTTPALTFQPGGPIDPREKATTLGEEISYAWSENLSLSVEYRKYDYDIAGGANYYGMRATYSVPDMGSMGLSLHRMDGEASRLQYDVVRIYGSKKIGKIDVVADLFDIMYDAPINGEDNALSASLSGGYNLTEKLKLAADVEYMSNPDYDKDVRAFIKLIYRFAYGKKEGV